MSCTLRLMVDEEPDAMMRMNRLAESSIGEASSNNPLGLEPWHRDTVAAQYMAAQPTQRVPLHHKTFSDALLYAGIDGGAIIMQTPDKRVLAMDYRDAADLEHHWRDTLRHYAGVL